jgi:hypothetical protein
MADINTYGIRNLGLFVHTKLPPPTQEPAWGCSPIQKFGPQTSQHLANTHNRILQLGFFLLRLVSGAAQPPMPYFILPRCGNISCALGAEQH